MFIIPQICHFTRLSTGTNKFCCAITPLLRAVIWMEMGTRFAHCSLLYFFLTQKNTLQLAKYMYPCMLWVKPLNKVYLLPFALVLYKKNCFKVQGPNSFNLFVDVKFEKVIIKDILHFHLSDRWLGNSQVMQDTWIVKDNLRSGMFFFF